MLRQPRDEGCAVEAWREPVANPAGVPGCAASADHIVRPVALVDGGTATQTASTEPGELGPRNWTKGRFNVRWLGAVRPSAHRKGLPAAAMPPTGWFPLYFRHQYLVFLGVALADVASTQQRHRCCNVGVGRRHDA